MTLNRIVRHTLPSKYDYAEFGTICQANYNEDKFELYIQLSETEEAQWEPIGFLLEKALCEMLQDPEFIQAVLDLAATKTNKDYFKLAMILTRK